MKYEVLAEVRAAADELVRNWKSGKLGKDDLTRGLSRLSPTIFGACGVEVGTDLMDYVAFKGLSGNDPSGDKPTPHSSTEPPTTRRYLADCGILLVTDLEDRIQSISTTLDWMGSFVTPAGREIRMGMTLPLSESELLPIAADIYRYFADALAAGVDDDHAPLFIQINTAEADESSYFGFAGIIFSMSSDRGTLYRLDVVRSADTKEAIQPVSETAVGSKEEAMRDTLQFGASLHSPDRYDLVATAYDGTSSWGYTHMVVSSRARNVVLGYAAGYSYGNKRYLFPVSVPAPLAAAMHAELLRPIYTDTMQLYGIGLGASIAVRLVQIAPNPNLPIQFEGRFEVDLAPELTITGAAPYPVSATLSCVHTPYLNVLLRSAGLTQAIDDFVQGEKAVPGPAHWSGQAEIAGLLSPLQFGRANLIDDTGETVAIVRGASLDDLREAMPNVETIECTIRTDIGRDWFGLPLPRLTDRLSFGKGLLFGSLQGNITAIGIGSF